MKILKSNPIKEKKNLVLNEDQEVVNGEEKDKNTASNKISLEYPHHQTKAIEVPDILKNKIKPRM